MTNQELETFENLMESLKNFVETESSEKIYSEKIFNDIHYTFEFLLMKIAELQNRIDELEKIIQESKDDKSNQENHTTTQID